MIATAGVARSAYTLRHEATSHWSANRARFALMVDIRGHADVKTTRRYARSNLERRRAALKQLADYDAARVDR